MRLPLARVDVLSHCSALSSRSVPGIREVKPTTPWLPGGSAVPSEVRLVAVVDGTPTVAGAPRSSVQVRRLLGVVAQQLVAEPVDEEHDVRRRPAARARSAPGAGVDPEGAPTAGRTSPSERSP